MIQLSEPLAGSKDSLTTTHDILLDGKRIGYVNVSYIGKDDVKTFRKYTKRKIVAGQPFGVQLFIDAVRGPLNAKSLGEEGLREIVLALVGHFKGLEERDIYILELNSSGKSIVGRGSQL
jgi:hypothetical protein